MAGRPKGAVETPRTLLRQDVREAVKFNKKVREMAEEQFKAVSEEIAGDPAVSLTKRLEFIKALSECLQGQSKGLEAVAKHFLTTDQQEEEGGMVGEDTVLKELRGGRK